MKFCKDCAHYTLPFEKAPLHLGLCNRKEAPKDPVTGSFEGSVPHPFCAAERVSLTGN